ATFSPELVDYTIYVIDVAEGDKIPRKGGPGITRSDLLIINKIDLAPYVGADLGIMDRDSRRMRGDRPFIFTNLMSGEGLDRVVSWIEPHINQHAHRGYPRRTVARVTSTENRWSCSNRLRRTSWQAGLGIRSTGQPHCVRTNQLPVALAPPSAHLSR